MSTYSDQQIKNNVKIFFLLFHEFYSLWVLKIFVYLASMHHIIFNISGTDQSIFDSFIISENYVKLKNKRNYNFRHICFFFC